MRGGQKRKTCIRLNAAGHLHFLTFSCYEDLPLLEDDRWKMLFSESLTNTCRKQSLILSAFVYMPEHVHLLICPTEGKYDISRFLFAVKRPFSFRVKKALEANKSELLGALTIRNRPGHVAFRFWQEGGGHDHNIISLENAVSAVEYIHNNPVRRGLCNSPDEWKWSSWKYYHDQSDYDTECLPDVSGLPL